CSPFNKADIGTLSLAGPLVFALSCLTGNYEGQWEWVDPNGTTETHTDGDDGFAETFFNQGAAVYIGATEVSSASQNDVAGPAFFRQWDPSEPAGKAFGEYRRNRAAAGDSSWKYWALEYNYYGDLKFGALDGGISAASVGGPTLSIAAAEPLPASPEIEVPQYEVVSADGRHRVTIPGGDVLIESGRPMVPTYRIEWQIPPGVVVQDVRMRHRGGLQTDVGLVLPVAIMRIDASAEPVVQDETLPGWYPRRDLHWQVIPKAHGVSTLAVTLYPFEYNPQTTESCFYSRYTLDIEMLDSGVRITTVLTDKLTYAMGEPVTVKIGLRAEGAPQDAFVDTVVRQYGSDELIAGLLLDNLSGLHGTASYRATWDSIAAPPGFYYIETKIADTAGQVLARETSSFRLISQP
ncbi:MAG TPA: C25 family cysteine peptidase, partial [Sedimentisphaerales bacterium]|nr:C25 family cysteine peptidase [Sedimentisphaerales bacterium]